MTTRAGPAVTSSSPPDPGPGRGGAVLATPGRGGRLGRLRRVHPALALVCAPVVFNLVALRHEASVVSTLNDSSFHEQMVRYAVHQLQLGHLPLDGWYPYLGLGSPLFLHYQSLGATLAGLLGLAIGGDRAFSIALYLLVALWPVCVYLAARLLGLTRWQAGGAAVVSSFVASATGVGYEQPSYLFVGFGVWSQLIGMWGLPLAWGFTARAIRHGRGYALSAFFIAFTIASHFITGYLTALPLVLVPLAAPSELRRRLRRSAFVALCAFLASAWVTLPLVLTGRYTSLNEFLQGSVDTDSYGARQALRWLFDGSLFDFGRLLPVLTVLVLVGLARALWRWREDEVARLLALCFGVALVAFFGRPTLGPLLHLLPGARDLFLRRFVVGVQLAGILLAGVALERLAAGARSLAVRRTSWRLAPRPLLAGIGAVVATTALLAPAWTHALSTDNRDAFYVGQQRANDASIGPAIAELVAQAEVLGPGRFFAGNPTDGWGSLFTVGSSPGSVPVFKYLASLDVDLVGYTLRTSSLMTDPEGYFDEDDPADYPLFGIRYLLLPALNPPAAVGQVIAAARATLVERVGGDALYETHGDGYFRVVQTAGVIPADRTDIGLATEAFVHSSLALDGPYPVIAYGGQSPPATTLPAGGARATTGAVLAAGTDLPEGLASATVSAAGRSVVVLAVSYDPGWTATVDGRAAPTQMVAPALVGVAVSPGRHVVAFRYRPPSYYPELFALAVVGLAGPALLERSRRRRRGGSPAPDS
ncbi:MAG TPA: DUF6541 family protein [Acidimicrobiales bacterium]|nr:DUF6541 family protein [Acidimicrobiales bacterium]